jgi:AAA domain
MTTDAAHRFEQHVNDCRKLLAAVATQDTGTRLKVFRSCAHELAQGFIPRGIEKATVADALHGCTETYLADVLQDDVQSIIADEIAEAEQIERVPDDVGIGEEPRTNGARPEQSEQPKIAVLTKAQFLAGFIPPDYLVDGVLQRRFVYSLTAVTGHGKTAVALQLARAVGSVDPDACFGPHPVKKGKVIYFVGENPDDVRCRIIGDDSTRSDDPDRDRIYFIPGVFDIAGLRAEIVSIADRIGGVDLVIVDTSAAYFLQQDENSNPQIGAHARMLRSLTTLPGGPCVAVLCHPIKHVIDPSQLLPRGGGAFMAEMDGNLTAWKHDDNLVTFHHSADKFRGPGFEPITFKLEKITTSKLVDSNGRMLPTVQAVAISEREEAEQEASAEGEEDKLMAELYSNPDRSVADLARACGWLLATGEPHKSKVDRVLNRLRVAKLAKKVRGRRWRLTDEGRKLVEQDDETVEDRSGAVGSKKAFHALRGMKQRNTVPCTYCGLTGDVYKFADGRLPKGQRHHADLHEGCAEDFFNGKPKPVGDDPTTPESLFH